MKVCIIGAGASGLAAIKVCLDCDLDPTCFEKTADLGGYWKFKWDEGEPSVYSSCVSKTSKELHAYSQFPPPAAWPNFWHHTRMLKYLQSYAKHYSLDYYIRHNCLVTKVDKAVDYERTGRFDVTYTDLQCKEGTVKQHTESFDAVLCCTGRQVPIQKQIAGSDNFHGDFNDCLFFKDSGRYNNETVVVHGYNQTAIDIACDLCRVCKKVYISVDQPFALLPCLSAGRNGPADLGRNRLKQYLGKFIKTTTSNKLPLFDWSEMEEHASVESVFNDELVFFVLSDRISIKPKIDYFDADGTTVHFADESSALDVDSILTSDGYLPDLDYVAECVEDYSCDELYLHMFIPGMTHPTLCFIGLVQSADYGSLIPLAEMQSRIACAALQKRLHIPTVEQIDNASVDEVPKRKVNVLVEEVPLDACLYTHELSLLIGCDPPLFSSLMHSISLFFELWLGPLVSYQFRLRGRNANYNSALRCIVNVDNRVKVQPICVTAVELAMKKSHEEVGRKHTFYQKIDLAGRRMSVCANKMITSVNEMFKLPKTGGQPPTKAPSKMKKRRNVAAVVLMVTAVSVTVYQTFNYIYTFIYALTDYPRE